ncbi:cobalamin biosynthesis protein [uncultured Sphingomonas sp.]|uniref:cobalamin biosynthesis protein n=1 Tax=uncultured Sphingomonas sp. TaxID=158754 RepID=UPI0025FC6F54|nr:cobalamin biosynthesis protein [uncultured Sphingomonas sp.]
MIIAGFGCRAGATPASLRSALALTGARDVTALAAPSDRAHLLMPVAEALGLTLIPLAPDILSGVETPTRSPTSLATRGTGSVAEAAALAAAGPGARLLVTRRIAPDRMATCAIAAASSCPEARS